MLKHQTDSLSHFVINETKAGDYQKTSVPLGLAHLGSIFCLVRVLLLSSRRTLDVEIRLSLFLCNIRGVRVALFTFFTLPPISRLLTLSLRRKAFVRWSIVFEEKRAYLAEVTLRLLRVALAALYALYGKV